MKNAKDIINRFNEDGGTVGSTGTTASLGTNPMPSLQKKKDQGNGLVRGARAIAGGVVGGVAQAAINKHGANAIRTALGAEKNIKLTNTLASLGALGAGHLARGVIQKTIAGKGNNSMAADIAGDAIGHRVITGKNPLSQSGPDIAKSLAHSVIASKLRAKHNEAIEDNAMGFAVDQLKKKLPELPVKDKNYKPNIGDRLKQGVADVGINLGSHMAGNSIGQHQLNAKIANGASPIAANKFYGPQGNFAGLKGYHKRETDSLGALGTDYARRALGTNDHIGKIQSGITDTAADLLAHKHYGGSQDPKTLAIGGTLSLAGHVAKHYLQSHAMDNFYDVGKGPDVAAPPIRDRFGRMASKYPKDEYGRPIKPKKPPRPESPNIYGRENTGRFSSKPRPNDPQNNP